MSDSLGLVEFAIGLVFFVLNLPCIADSLGLVEFAIGLVFFVLNLPDGQVLFFGVLQLKIIID